MKGVLWGAIVVAGVKFVLDYRREKQKLESQPAQEKQKFESQLIQNALASNDVKTRTESLKFLIETNLITNPQIRKGWEEYYKNKPLSSQIKSSPTVDQVYSKPIREIKSVVSTVASTKEKSNTLSEMESKHFVLVGLKVRHGDIIDAITPVFDEISSTGVLVGSPIEGQRIGGEGGQEKFLKEEGYIITGLNIYRGNYFGRDEVVHIEVIWNQPTSQEQDFRYKKISEKLGSGNYALDIRLEEFRVKQGHYISDFNVSTSDHTSGETFLHDINGIVEKKLA